MYFWGFGGAHPKPWNFHPPQHSLSSPFSMNGTKAAETAQSTTIAAPANKCGPGKSFSARNLKKSHQVQNVCISMAIAIATPIINSPLLLIATFFGGVVVASHLNFSGWNKKHREKLRFFILPKKNGWRLPHLTAGVFFLHDLYPVETPTRPFRRLRKIF